jgi:hypothetical protein
MKMAMTATRLVANKEGDNNGGKSNGNGNEVAGQRKGQW